MNIILEPNTRHSVVHLTTARQWLQHCAHLSLLFLQVARISVFIHRYSYWYLLQSTCLLHDWSHKRAVDFDSLVYYRLNPVLERCCLLKFTVLFHSPVASTLINSRRSVSPSFERIVLFIEPSTCPFLQKLASVLYTFSSLKQRIPSLTPFFGNIFSLHYSLCYLCYFVFFKPSYYTWWAPWKWIIAASMNCLSPENSTLWIIACYSSVQYSC